MQAGATKCSSHAQWLQQQHFPRGILTLPFQAHTQHATGPRPKRKVLWSWQRISPTPSFPLPQKHGFRPGHSGVVSGRIKFLALPRIVIRAVE
eukprot:1867199-Amphidinium_carterae.1